MCTILVTGDRLVATMLTLKHRLHWTVGRSKLLVRSTWIVSWLVVFPLSSALYFSYGWKWLQQRGITLLVLHHVPSLLNLFFFIFALTSYITMFVVFIRSRRSFNGENHTSIFQLFRRSKFYTSVLLVASFLVLNVVPSLVSSSATIMGLDLPPSVRFAFVVAWCLSDTVDAVIYVLLCKPVSSSFWRAVGRMLGVVRRFAERCCIPLYSSDGSEGAADDTGGCDTADTSSGCVTESNIVSSVICIQYETNI